MNILIANWSWYPSGGDWTAIANLIKLYQLNGHTIIPFSMKDVRNYQTPYEKYFIENIDYKELNKRKSFTNGIKVLRRSIYSQEARKKLKQLLQDIKIDIAHIHNLGPQITPSIISLLKNNGIPIMWTLHDYGMLCPATSFVSKGEVCERCKIRKFYNCTLRKCKKNSYTASFIASLRSYILRTLNAQKYVDLFLCPSKFLAAKFIEYGFDKNRLIQIYNPFDLNDITLSSKSDHRKNSDYILYVGRIEKIKGIHTLLSAMRYIKNVDLVIIGKGEEETVCKDFVGRHHLSNVCFQGHLEKEAVISYINGSLFTVCPSEWYENFPYSIVEPMALGKAVIGSRIGGIPELVIDGQTGATFNPGDVDDLKNKIELLLSDKELLKEYGNNARDHVTKMVNFESHYKTMEIVFKNLQRN